jgi:nitrogen fixation/metabolism regulation signal transduction histidine kinase
MYADAYNILFWIMTANLLCMLFISGMIFRGANKVVEPIRVLAQKARRVASGDFKYDIFDSPENKPQGKSEAAALQRAFNEMLHALQENLLTVEKRVDERTRELKKLNNYIALLMNNTTSYSLLLDRDAKIIYHSDSLKTMTGAPTDETYINMPLLDAFKLLFKDANYLEAGSHRMARAMAGEDIMEDDTIVWPTGDRSIYRIS